MPIEFEYYIFFSEETHPLLNTPLNNAVYAPGYFSACACIRQSIFEYAIRCDLSAYSFHNTYNTYMAFPFSSSRFCMCHLFFSLSLRTTSSSDCFCLQRKKIDMITRGIIQNSIRVYCKWIELQSIMRDRLSD